MANVPSRTLYGSMALPVLNSRHPLAVGLGGFWLAHPALFHSQLWIDLAGQNHATLTGMTLPGGVTGWSPERTRPGGTGSVRFNGVNGAYVRRNGPLFPPPQFPPDASKPFSIACWFLTRQTASTADLIALTDSPTSVAKAVIIRLSLGALVVIRASGGNILGGTTIFKPTTEAWYHCAYTFDGTNHSLFVNGQRLQSSNNAFDSGALSFLFFGAFVQGGANAWNGNIDAVQIWSRTLGASEIATLYALSLRGFPGLLTAPRRIPFTSTTPPPPSILPPPLTARAPLIVPLLTQIARPPVLTARATPIVPVINQIARPSPLTAKGTLVVPQILFDQIAKPPPLTAKGALIVPNILFNQIARPPVLTAKGTLVIPHLRFNQFATVPALRFKGHLGTPTMSLQTRPVRLDPTVVAALAEEFIAGDWLIQAPALGLKLSYDYNPDGTWEHRIATISDPTITVPPGGGIASIANVTVSVIDNQTGQSLLELYQKFSTTLGLQLTIDVLLRGQTDLIRIFTGRIDSLATHDALTDLIAVDDSLHFNPQIPQLLFTTDVFPNADASVIGQPIPLVYGRGRGTLPPQLPADIVVPAGPATVIPVTTPPLSTPPDVLNLAITYPVRNKTVLLTWTGQAYYGDTIDFYDVYAQAATNQAGDCAAVAYVATVVHPTQQYTLTIGNNAGVAVRVLAHSPTTGYGPLSPCVTFFGTDGYYLISITQQRNATQTFNVPSCVTGDLISIAVHADVQHNSGVIATVDLHAGDGSGVILDEQILSQAGGNTQEGATLLATYSPPTGTQLFTLTITGAAGNPANTWVAQLWRPA